MSFVFWILMCGGSALAQDVDPAPPLDREARFAEVTRVDFDRALAVEGELVKPSLTHVEAGRRAMFASFIRLRSDFDEEVRASARWVR